MEDDGCALHLAYPLPQLYAFLRFTIVNIFCLIRRLTERESNIKTYLSCIAALTKHVKADWPSNTVSVTIVNCLSTN